MGCKIRLCAKQKGYRTCAECTEAEVYQKLHPYRRYFEPALKRIREKGPKGYSEEMWKKVNQGYSYPAELNSPP